MELTSNSCISTAFISILNEAKHLINYTVISDPNSKVRHSIHTHDQITHYCINAKYENYLFVIDAFDNRFYGKISGIYYDVVLVSLVTDKFKLSYNINRNDDKKYDPANHVRVIHEEAVINIRTDWLATTTPVVEYINGGSDEDLILFILDYENIK